MNAGQAAPHEHPHNHPHPHNQYAAHQPPSARVPGVVTFEDLAQRFGQTQQGTLDGELAGSWYHQALAEQAAIAQYQWERDIRRGAVKGYLLAGPPGTGKTTLAHRLAYELGRRTRHSGSGDVALVLIDGGEIARSRYGESEERIRAIFRAAQEGFGDHGRRIVLLLDDVESVVMARGSENAKEWHYAQDSVFFHAIDELDTSKTIVVLTTNRPDLVDEAIRDRFLRYDLPDPSPELLVEVGLRVAREHDMGQEMTALLESYLHETAKDGATRSMRDAERAVLRFYVAGILERSIGESLGGRPTEE